MRIEILNSSLSPTQNYSLEETSLDMQSSYLRRTSESTRLAYVIYDRDSFFRDMRSENPSADSERLRRLTDSFIAGSEYVLEESGYGDGSAPDLEVQDYDTHRDSVTLGEYLPDDPDTIYANAHGIGVLSEFPSHLPLTLPDPEDPSRSVSYTPEEWAAWAGAEETVHYLQGRGAEGLTPVDEEDQRWYDELTYEEQRATDWEREGAEVGKGTIRELGRRGEFGEMDTDDLVTILQMALGV